MQSKGRVRKLFPGGNTPMGFYSFFDHIIGPDASRVFIIKGGPGVGKSTLMRKVESAVLRLGYDVEEHRCASDPQSLDALVVPALKVALIDGTAPHIVDPKNPGLVDEIINLGEYWDESKIREHADEIRKLNSKAGKMFQIAFSRLREAKVAYDEWKSYASDCMDKSAYLSMVKELISSVFDKTDTGLRDFSGAAASRHLFGSAITPQGNINYCALMLDRDMRLYSIKGDPGSGVKEAIAKVAQVAEEMGIFTERFHCPFEPETIDAVLIPGIKTAVLNTNTPYHCDITEMDEFEPKMEVDFNNCLELDYLNEYDTQRLEAQKRCYSLIDSAVNCLSKAKDLHDQLEGYYVAAMDFVGMKEMRQRVLEKIMALAV